MSFFWALSHYRQSQQVSTAQVLTLRSLVVLQEHLPARPRGLDLQQRCTHYHIGPSHQHQAPICKRSQVLTCVAGAHRVLLQEGRAAGPPCPGARYGWFRCQEADHVPGNICVPLCQPRRGAACVACTDANATCNAVRLCCLPTTPALARSAQWCTGLLIKGGSPRRPGRRSMAHWAPTSR